VPRTVAPFMLLTSTGSGTRAARAQMASTIAVMSSLVSVMTLPVAAPSGAESDTAATPPDASEEADAVPAGAESDVAASVPVATDDADADAVGADRVIDGNEPVAEPPAVEK